MTTQTMTIKEAQQVEADRREREAREAEAASVLRKQRQVEVARRGQEAKRQQLLGEITECETALKVFSEARDGFAGLPSDALYRCGARARSSGMVTIPDTRELPAALSAAVAAATERLERLRAELAELDAQE